MAPFENYCVFSNSVKIVEEHFSLARERSSVTGNGGCFPRGYWVEVFLIGFYGGDGRFSDSVLGAGGRFSDSRLGG